MAKNDKNAIFFSLLEEEEEAWKKLILAKMATFCEFLWNLKWKYTYLEVELWLLYNVYVYV